MINISQIELDPSKLKYLKRKKLRDNKELWGKAISDELESYIQERGREMGIKLNHGDFRLLNKLSYLTGTNSFPTTLSDLDLAVRMDEEQRTVSRRLGKLAKLGLIIRKTTSRYVNGHPISMREIKLNPVWFEPLGIAELNELNDLYKELYEKYKEDSDTGIQEENEEIPLPSKTVVPVVIPKQPHIGSRGPCTREEFIEWQKLVYDNRPDIILNFIDEQ